MICAMRFPTWRPWVNHFTIGRILNHVETSVTATYDRHSYDAGKRRRWKPAQRIDYHRRQEGRWRQGRVVPASGELMPCESHFHHRRRAADVALHLDRWPLLDRASALAANLLRVDT
jgi:hypothetical protein